MQDEELIIKNCKKYDSKAQRLVFEAYAPYIKGICMRYVFDKAEAADVTQEVFLKAFDKIKQYQGTGSFKAWLRSIAVSTAINHYNANKKHNLHLDIDEEVVIGKNNLVQENQDHYNSFTDDIDISDIDPDKIDFDIVIKAGFTLEELQNAVMILPDPFRIVFNLFYIESYKHAEIAELLGIDENTSKTRLHRAKNGMKKHLYKLSIQKVGKEPCKKII